MKQKASPRHKNQVQIAKENQTRNDAENEEVSMPNKNHRAKLSNRRDRKRGLGTEDSEKQLN